MNKSTKVLLIVFLVLLTAGVTYVVTSISLAAHKTPQTASYTPQQTQAQSQSGQEQQSTPTEQQQTMEDTMDKLEEIRAIIDRYYIGEVDEKAMSDALAAGMINGLQDEWSLYIPAEDYMSYVENTNNAYVGIGVTITLDEQDRGFVITDVTPESPAYNAGLENGDVITRVFGESVIELGIEETKNRVRGEEGTDVTLTVLHGETEREVVITRATIKVVSVISETLSDGVVYIKIKNFERNTARDAINAVKAAVRDKASGIVFDVRFNPGGLKDELVELLDYLLPEGALFRSVEYDGTESVDYSDASCVELPMAVLVNKESYSAAEFFAAALQEYGAAKIVGTQTYGKGYFQVMLPLSDGSAINLSIGKYTTPQGKSLVGVGVTPDYVVEVSTETYADIYYSRLAHEDDEQLKTAISALKD